MLKNGVSLVRRRASLQLNKQVYTADLIKWGSRPSSAPPILPRVWKSDLAGLQLRSNNWVISSIKAFVCSYVQHRSLLCSRKKKTPPESRLYVSSPRSHRLLKSNWGEYCSLRCRTQHMNTFALRGAVAREHIVLKAKQEQTWKEYLWNTVDFSYQDPLEVSVQRRWKYETDSLIMLRTRHLFHPVPLCPNRAGIYIYIYIFNMSSTPHLNQPLPSSWSRLFSGPTIVKRKITAESCGTPHAARTQRRPFDQNN